MKRIATLAIGFFVSIGLSGCGDSGGTVPFEKSELEKYVEENPVPLVGAEDFKAVDADPQ